MAKRINTTVEEDLYEEITAAASEAGVTRTDIVVGLLSLWTQDPALQEAATTQARAHRKLVLERQYTRRRDK